MIPKRREPRVRNPYVRGVGAMVGLVLAAVALSSLLVFAASEVGLPVERHLVVPFLLGTGLHGLAAFLGGHNAGSEHTGFASALLLVVAEGGAVWVLAPGFPFASPPVLLQAAVVLAGGTAGGWLKARGWRTHLTG